MPRTVRNFWIDACVDGRQSDIGTGPRGPQGGFSLTVYQREDNDVRHALSVRGSCDREGNLTLSIQNEYGHTIHQFLTKR